MPAIMNKEQELISNNFLNLRHLRKYMETIQYLGLIIINFK